MDEKIQEKLWQLAFRKPYDSEFFIPVVKGKKINFTEIFPPFLEKFTLELGSGWGEVAIELATQNPKTGYILMEKKISRIKTTLKQIHQRKIQNIRIIPADFSHFLADIFIPNQLNEIILNFPDPWPKKKHRKNRTLNQNFPNILNYLLQNQGVFHFASDYGPYARAAIRIFRNDSRFSFKDKFSLSRVNFPPSRFEMERKTVVPRLYYLKRTLTNGDKIIGI